MLSLQVRRSPGRRMRPGRLASRNSGSAAMNWIEQSVNCLGQALLLGGVYALHRAGLRECRQL